MSRPLDPVVPGPLRALLDADPGDPAVDGFTLLLLTLRADGWPHQAMLSVGEVAAVAGNRLRLAVWPGSTSTANLRAHGRATLTAVVGGVAYALFLAAEPTADAGTLACFDARVEQATADEAPYARLDGGVRFTLTDRDATIARWRETREALQR
ncbi:hypothetical protein Q5424_07750 [Conexibacter sp. JD483]|uniref:hypothetical protein n=1 Tax=unclassified Conexibacter TaxID=2627773 RepID=UPI00271FE4E2|nr:MULTISPECIES: hypothetical protein [unclassified Conexibacter]MDO8186006.1 hypothetical protein [Conexibacter sp. CPCC 205706]MDO8199496.1 hypothetical protein [Conexibacter sp. CPCC 205762]MDR9368969.1 hypothetical protein [Conexibacter sp. JD483]